MQVRTYCIFICLLACTLGARSAYPKNRNPKDYPEGVKVTSFQRQPCVRQFGTITRVCHIIGFELAGQKLTGSCFHCDPLLPGKTYPARFDRKELILYVIHQKDNGTWGQDDYAITEMSDEGSNTTKPE